MMSHYVNMERATSGRVLMMQFASRPQQPPFAPASDGAGPMRYNHITGERN